MLTHKLRTSASLVTLPRRTLFGKIFGKNKRVGGCQKEEEVFQAFKAKIEDRISDIEQAATYPEIEWKNHLVPEQEQSEIRGGSLQYLMSTLLNCQRVEVQDKFFYESLLNQIEERLDHIYNPKDLIQLAISLAGLQLKNEKVLEDHKEFMRKFYAHCCNNRFLLAQEDKNSLTQIFQEMKITKVYSGHLNLHKDFPRA